MMKKILLIFIPILLLTAGAIWYWLSPRDRGPVAETISNLLPFGSGEGMFGSDSENGSPSEESEFAEGELEAINNLFKISAEPVAGAVAFNKSSTTVAVRYVDRATGHIFEALLPQEGSTAISRVKIANRTLPKIYEAHFRSDGSAVLLRYLRDDSDTVENLSLILTPPRATTTDGLYNVEAVAFRGDIESVAPGTGNTIYYSLENSGTIVSSAFNASAVRNLFTSAFSDWRLAPAGQGLFIYPKASASATGYAYTVGANGALSKVLGPLNGLAVVPDASGTRVVYSYMDGVTNKSEARNLQSGATTSILPATLAEKCVWSTRTRGVLYCATPSELIGGNEPGDWYRGASHYTDRLWRFDTNAEIAQIISEPKASLNLDIDVYEPKLSPNEDYLIFINKRDLSLWALRLERI